MRIFGKAARAVLLVGFLFGMNTANAAYAPGIAHPSGHAHADPLSACIHAISETTYTPHNAAPVVETGPGSPPAW